MEGEKRPVSRLDRARPQGAPGLLSALGHADFSQMLSSFKMTNFRPVRKTLLMKQASQFSKITIISLITASPKLPLISITAISQRAGPTSVGGAERSTPHVLQGTRPVYAQSLGGKVAPGSELPTNQGTGTTATERRP